MKAQEEAEQADMHTQQEAAFNRVGKQYAEGAAEQAGFNTQSKSPKIVSEGSVPDKTDSDEAA